VSDINGKKVALVVIVLFLGFYLFRDPSGLADLAEQGGSSAWGLTTQLFEATIRFLDELV
jgi:hypothetical protein